jgi:hypothetical protein
MNTVKTRNQAPYRTATTVPKVMCYLPPWYRSYANFLQNQATGQSTVVPLCVYNLNYSSSW